MAVIIPDELNNKKDDDLYKRVDTLYEYLPYMKEMIEFWGRNRTSEISSANKGIAVLSEGVAENADAIADLEPRVTACETNIEQGGKYQAGDTLSLSELTLGGLVSSSTKNCRFAIITPKELTDISSISVTAITGGIRTTQGAYLEAVTDNTSWLGRTGITVSAVVKDTNVISLNIDKTSAFTNVTNNTPVAAWFKNLVFEFN